VLLVLVLAAIVVAAGCQVQVDVATKVNDDGSGTVTASVGLDDGAMARVGDLRTQMRVDDLTQTGWAVSGPAKEGDGLTWVRATKSFTDAAGATAALGEITGPDGAFRNFVVKRDSGLMGTFYSYSGTIDLTNGPATFSDPDLAKALGGDPFGGTLTAIEQAEGKRAADMVDFRVSVELPGGQTKAWNASFADPAPTELKASSSTGTLLPRLVVAALLVTAVVALAIFLWRRYGPNRPMLARPSKYV